MDETQKPSLNPSVQAKRTISPTDIGMKRTQSWNKLEVQYYPSYSRLRLPYRVVCRQRYQSNGRTQHKQFIEEIKMHMDMQCKALDGVRMFREFCDPILVKVKRSELISLTLEQERKVEYLLRTDPKDL